jgi:hypothetical protein
VLVVGRHSAPTDTKEPIFANKPMTENTGDVGDVSVPLGGLALVAVLVGWRERWFVASMAAGVLGKGRYARMYLQ